ncbi:MAG: hypothetical protein NW241_03480 [Bacteroidia bacterium]|nr:hypothetical protein [Bacteroidia bacterium]
MMIELNIRISNPRDLAVLLPLLNRLGLPWEQRPHPPEAPVRDQEALRQIIAQGGDAAYFGDAGEWQREARTDRQLPFEDEA